MFQFITKKIITLRKFSLTSTITDNEMINSKYQMRYFADRVRLRMLAGNGGYGVTSYYTDKRIRRGQPNGGCGGKGGDIILEAHSSLYDLSHLRKRIVNGNDGQRGGNGGKEGKNGGKTVIRVPCGTLVYEIKNMQDIQDKKFVVDLCTNKQTVIIAKGGQAGKGNKKFPYSLQQSRIGKVGQQKIVYLELKTLADVGLVGFPNIGKSTFLAAVSRALPKIANYQFTTLKPSVGYVKFVDGFSMTVADIPGIIQEAHKNKGLGLQFLRHIQRTKVLLFVLDITKQNPAQQYKLLKRQLNQYSKQTFNNKKCVIALNKCDCLTNPIEKFERIKKEIWQNEPDNKPEILLISAKESFQIGQVLIELRKNVQIIRQEEQKVRTDQFKFQQLVPK